MAGEHGGWASSAPASVPPGPAAECARACVSNKDQKPPMQAAATAAPPFSAVATPPPTTDQRGTGRAAKSAGLLDRRGPLPPQAHPRRAGGSAPGAHPHPHLLCLLEGGAGEGGGRRAAQPSPVWPTQISQAAAVRASCVHAGRMSPHKHAPGRRRWTGRNDGGRLQRHPRRGTRRLLSGADATPAEAEAAGKRPAEAGSGPAAPRAAGSHVQTRQGRVLAAATTGDANFAGRRWRRGDGARAGTSRKPREWLDTPPQLSRPAHTP